MHTAETNYSLSSTPQGTGKQFQQFYGIEFSGDQAVNVGSIKAASTDADIDVYATEAKHVDAG